MNRTVIYKDFIGLCVTSEENYNARIQDARKITKCYDFENPEQIVESFKKWYGSSDDEFIIKVA